MLNKKRMLSLVLAFAVILSCLIIPNKANAAEYKDKDIEAGVYTLSTGDYNDYYLYGRIFCANGIKDVKISITRLSEKDKVYRSKSYTLNKDLYGKKEIMLYELPATDFVSKLRDGKYQLDITATDCKRQVIKATSFFTIDKYLDSYMVGLYRGLLGRDPDEKGYYDNINEVVKHRHTIKQMVVAFYDSPEYQKNRTGLTNRQYVESLYDAVLGRKYDQGGLDSWVNNLNSGRLTRRQVLLRFLDSEEFNKTVIPQYHLEKYR